MRTTKDLNIALERAADLLPGGSVEAHAHGKRRLVFRRPGRGRYVTEGTIARCLYVALLAASERRELGGLGIPMDEVRDAVRLRPEGVPAPDAHGVGAHERNLMQAASLRLED